MSDTRLNPSSKLKAFLNCALFLFFLFNLPVSVAKTIEIFPPPPGTSDCNEEFEMKANELQPGDTLILRGGVYSQSCRRAISNINGTAAAPITIRAAENETPVLTRPVESRADQNNIEIENSSYLIIDGLSFQRGDSGVRFIGGHHITLTNCEIYETANNAISMNSGNSDSFIIRDNHIHHTGLWTSSTTEGEGMYIGCNYDSCRTTNSIIEGNYIHHLRGTSSGGNDGIEIKVGSYGNIVRNNVIHDTNIGQKFPCIFVYGGGAGVNIVEGNVMWNCGEAIQVVSDAVIRNNIILNSAYSGITAAAHEQVASMKNVTIVNNTISGHPECVSIAWNNASNMIFANNAVYCGQDTAVNASGLQNGAVTVKENYVEGALSGASIDNNRFYSGGTSASAFSNPGSMDFWPGQSSILRGNANAIFAPSVDFNGTIRTQPHDVGAYATRGLASNPGWNITSGFKTSSTSGDSMPPSAPTGLSAGSP